MHAAREFTQAAVICILAAVLPRPASADSVVDRTAAALESVPAQVQSRDGLRGEDRKAYLNLLDLVASVDTEELKREATRFRNERITAWDAEFPNTRFSAFADVLANPELYQGQVVGIVGHANRVVSYKVPRTRDVGESEDAPAKDATVYESWVVTDDSQQYPWVVVTGSVPPETPIGETEVVGVAATGVVFQVFTYRSRDGKTRYAPLIIADTWSRPLPVSASSSQWLLAAMAVLFGLSISWTIVKLLRPGPRRRLVSGPAFSPTDMPAMEAEFREADGRET